MKQAYITPELILHGSVETITLNGSLQNADVDGGPDGTADCPGGSTLPECVVS